MVKKLPDKQMGCVNCKKIWILPGLSLFLAFLFTLTATASIYPQVTLDVKSENLSTVLVQLKDATNVQILFNEDVIRNVKCSSVTLQNTPINEALDAILKNTGFTYKEVNDVFVINQLPLQQQPVSVKISGLVIDLRNTPLIGVSIVNVEKKTGTITLADGRYELNVVEGDRLRFSYIGYKTREVEVTSAVIRNKTLNVTLTEDVFLIEGVAVIGYGTTQKIKDATGSIAHLGIKAIETSPTSSTIQSMLQGRAAGVNVQIQSSSPTSPISVIIRGQSSLLGNNQPLWVIDGIPEYNTGLSGTISNVLYSLNLNDVESIDILKDASSTAIYGSRAANGVIVVTTKSGKAGRKPTIEFSTKLGVQKMDFNGYDYFSAKEYINFTQKAVRKELFIQGGMNYFTRQYLDEAAFLALNSSEIDMNRILDNPNAYFNEDNHWLGMSTQNPFQQQHDLSARGGSEVINYVAGLYVKDFQGVVKGSYSRTYGVRLKLNTKINKSLKFWMNINVSTRDTSSKDEMMDRLKACRPDMPKYNEDGTLFNSNPYTENPLNYLENTDKSSGESFAGIAALEYTLIDGLTLSSKGSINYLNGENLRYKRMGSFLATTNSRNWSANKSDTKIWDNSVMYAKLINKHDILANVTFSMERFQSLFHNMNASGFPDDEVLNSFSNATKYNSMGEGYSQNSMLSLIGRFQYKFDNRYLATVTFRRDGSSRFGPDKKWGLFPSVGVGWVISNEKFMQNGWIGRNLNHAKIRASYGKAGSQNLGNYQWMSMVSSNVYNEAPGIYPMNIGNMELRWEESLMTDIALELELWDSRIKAMFGFFNKDARNLIYEQTLPPSTAFNNMTSNIASTASQGFEFNVDVDILRSSQWWLTFNVNGATNTTKVTKFNNSMTEWKLDNTYTMIEKGGKIGNWYGFKTNRRLLGSGEEAAALKGRDPKTGAIRNYQNILESEGDIYLVDINGDGVVNLDDRTVLGSSLPKLFGGFGLNLQVGSSLYVGASFAYSLGNKRLWSMAMTSMQTGNNSQSNKIAGMSAILKDPHNQSTFPNATPYDFGNNNKFSDYWLFDASYVRLNSLNIRYRFVEEYFKRSMIQNIELSLQADNLFTITNYPGFDPQGNFSSATQIMATQGVDYSFYPAAKTFTLGVKITF